VRAPRRTRPRFGRRAAPGPVAPPPVVDEVRQLRLVARHLAELAERLFAGQPVPGNPWAELLRRQEEPPGND